LGFDFLGGEGKVLRCPKREIISTETTGSKECTSCPDYISSDPRSTSCHCKDSFLSTIDPFTNEPACKPNHYIPSASRLSIIPSRQNAIIKFAKKNQPPKCPKILRSVKHTIPVNTHLSVLSVFSILLHVFSMSSWCRFKTRNRFHYQPESPKPDYISPIFSSLCAYNIFITYNWS